MIRQATDRYLTDDFLKKLEYSFHYYSQEVRNEKERISLEFKNFELKNENQNIVTNIFDNQEATPQFEKIKSSSKTEQSRMETGMAETILNKVRNNCKIIKNSKRYKDNLK